LAYHHALACILSAPTELCISSRAIIHLPAV